MEARAPLVSARLGAVPARVMLPPGPSSPPPELPASSPRCPGPTVSVGCALMAKLRLGPPACLGVFGVSARTMSVTEEQWHEWRQQQLTAQAAVEEKAAAHEEDTGAGSRAASQGQPLPRASSEPADVPAGKGTAPLTFEQRFIDRAALPKGAFSTARRAPRLSASTVTPLMTVLLAMVMLRCTMTPMILPAMIPKMTMPSQAALSRRSGLPLTPPWLGSRIGWRPFAACRRMISSFPERGRSRTALPSSGGPSPRAGPPPSPSS